VIWLVMGVTGCGKTTLGKALAERLKIPFYDADDFHPESNRVKLSQDQPLNDEDRQPWLQRLAGEMIHWEQAGGAVLACSALKESYRCILLGAGVPLKIVWLQISPAEARRRLATRQHQLVGRFEEILAAQFADLEPPGEALTVGANLGPEEQVAAVLRSAKPFAM
jgi:carbohydrate kinase (thermoresistant glucokinase family)